MGDAFKTKLCYVVQKLRCVYEKNGGAFTQREKKKIGDAFMKKIALRLQEDYDAFIEEEEKNATCPP